MPADVTVSNVVYLGYVSHVHGLQKEMYWWPQSMSCTGAIHDQSQSLL